MIGRACIEYRPFLLLKWEYLSMGRAVKQLRRPKNYICSHFTFSREHTGVGAFIRPNICEVHPHLGAG